MKTAECNVKWIVLDRCAAANRKASDMSATVPVVPEKYSVWKGIWKGVKTGALVAGPLVLTYLANESNTASILPPKYIGLAAVLSGLAKFLLNRQAHT